MAFPYPNAYRDEAVVRIPLCFISRENKKLA